MAQRETALVDVTALIVLIGCNFTLAGKTVPLGSVCRDYG
jgi:hypothetical protein